MLQSAADHFRKRNFPLVRQSFGLEIQLIGNLDLCPDHDVKITSPLECVNMSGVNIGLSEQNGQRLSFKDAEKF
jgi:hypothetical protein